MSQRASYFAVMNAFSFFKNNQLFNVFAQKHDFLLGNYNRNSLFFVQFFKKRKYLNGRCRVKLTGRLVQNKNFRFKGENCRKYNLLLLAAAKRRNLSVAQFRNAEAFQRRAYSFFNLLCRNAEVFQPEKNLVFYKVAGELAFDVLKYGTDFQRKFSGFNVKSIVTVYFDTSVEITGVVMRNKPVNAVAQRGFSRSGFSDNSCKIAFFYIKRNAFKCIVFCTRISECQFLYFNHVFFLVSSANPSAKVF